MVRPTYATLCIVPNCSGHINRRSETPVPSARRSPKPKRPTCQRKNGPVATTTSGYNSWLCRINARRTAVEAKWICPE